MGETTRSGSGAARKERDRVWICARARGTIGGMSSPWFRFALSGPLSSPESRFALLAFTLIALRAGAADRPVAVADPAATTGASAGEWFEWPAVEPRAGTALDLAGLNARPAGALGRIGVRDGHFATADGTRIRFWGCNISAAENFVDAEMATRLAHRLAQGGINIVRLHHLDNNWAVATRGSIWSPDDPRRLKIDPVQLDKVHRFVAALKAEGIYVNVNLKVSRTYSAADGFPASVSDCPPFQKRVDYFDRRMIELQKDYARQLLTAKNPYTGFSLADDPAVAVVEINNENALLGLRTRDVGRGLELLPEPFRGNLVALWNAWLARRYPDSGGLATAWRQGATAPGRSAVPDAARWHPDAQPGNEVTVDATDAPGGVHLDVVKSDGVRWRAAAYLDPIDLPDSETYTVTFAARADAARPVMVTLGRDDPRWRTDKWRTRGLYSTIALTTEWQPFRFVVNTHSVVDVGSRFSVMAGHQTGQVWLKDLRIESGSPTAGLQSGQSPAQGNVPLPLDATPAQWNDWLTFLLDTETSYVAEMRSYLIDVLKVRAPIVCTQANYGGIAGLVREKASDYIDAHCYWQHPDFGGLAGTWNLASWTINNTPQLGEFSPRWFGELGGIALLRVAGKPFSVTEVDHPAPSDYACEMYPELATFASVQDWDALYPFDMVQAGLAQDDGTIRTFFDQRHHPAKWGFAPFATRVFRLGLVPPAPARRELFVRGPVWSQANHLDVLWLRQQPGQDLGFLTDRLSVDENLLGPDGATHVERMPGKTAAAARLERTARGPVYVVNAPQAAAITGYLGGASLAEPELAIACDAFGLNFAAITAVALDARPMPDSARVLVTLAARAANQGAVWNEARTSVGDRWGHGPAIVEHVPATIRLKVSGPRQVFALAPDGTRAAEMKAELRDGWMAFSTRTGPRTMHYEIVPR